ncbi:MAG: SRPBCC domain-containing protein [Acidimicrobiia bacterium]
MKDIITRELSIKAEQENVYNVMAQPELITQWFPDRVEGNFQVGERAKLFFDGYNGFSQIYIETAQPYSHFGFRWAPGGIEFPGDVLDGPNTLVEFFLATIGDKTKVVVTESGFDSLPDDIKEQSWKMNSEGWDFMLSRLEKVSFYGD